MIYRYCTPSLAMLFASLLVLAGCNAQAGSGGSGPIPIGGSGDAGGNSVVTPGDNTGGGQTDADSNGNEDDQGTDVPGPDPDTGDGQDGDGSDPAPSGTPPSVVLNVSNLSPSVGDLLFLTCVVTDSGGLPPTSYQFDSTIGTATIFQVSSENANASAQVLASPLTVNYWCSATNDAGPGEPSPIVVVTIAGSGL